MSGTITPDGDPVHWQAIYFRYGTRYEDECDSLEDAVGLLWGGAEQGDLAPSGIRRPDGTLIEDVEMWALLDALTEQADTADAERRALP